MSAPLPPEDGELSEEQLREVIQGLETLSFPKELESIVRVMARDLKVLIEVPGPKNLTPIARLRAYLQEMTP